MKTGNILFTTLLLCTTLHSCIHRKEVIQHERGIVVEKQYFPETSGTAIGTSISPKGKVTPTIHHISESEKYIVIFKCDHNVVFSVNRSSVYGKLNKGDSVTIDYYEYVNKAGEVKDLEFIDANPEKNNSQSY
jgi:myo-inositol-hexaphosphate 3-phosphohydrolase